MAWDVLWPLILGFALSGAVQAVVSHRAMVRLFGDASARSLTFASLFGIASSSCSYAAVALARSLFLKGASFTAAMVFQLASTNLVIELGVILVVLMGWPFAAAQFTGGIIMIVLLALIFRFTLTPRLVDIARGQAERGVPGRMEGHAGMDMSVAGKLAAGPPVQRFGLHRGQPLLRDGLGLGLGRHRGRLSDRRRARRLGAPVVLAGVLPGGQSAAGGDRRAAGRAARGRAQLRVLGRQRAAGGRSLAGRNQFWRCGQLHLRRPDRVADPRYLPEVLHQPGGRVCLRSRST